jgi:hypothetical protein
MEEPVDAGLGSISSPSANWQSSNATDFSSSPAIPSGCQALVSKYQHLCSWVVSYQRIYGNRRDWNGTITQPTWVPFRWPGQFLLSKIAITLLRECQKVSKSVRILQLTVGLGIGEYESTQFSSPHRQRDIALNCSLNRFSLSGS